jgi:glycosyltransferase involved in cell wall biosynthesis
MGHLNPVKVIHVHKMTGISGSENHLLHLLTGLDSTRFNTVLLVLTAGGEVNGSYVDTLRERGIRVVMMPIQADVDPLLILRLVRWFRDEQPAIVHTHLIHGDLYGTLAATLARVPVLISTKHNDDDFRSRRAVRFMERRLVRSATKVIAISDWIREFVLRMTDVEPDRVVTVRYGYDPVRNDRSGRREVLERYGVPAGSKLVLSVGRLVRQKGHEDLIRAFVRVLNEIPDAWLLIAGEGDLRSDLERLAQSLGIGDRVLMPGYVNDAGRLFPACDVYAHPSWWEGFGLVLLEAMAAERPIVAAKVSAVPEIVQHGETGLLVPPKEPDALASALIELLHNRSRAEILGRAGLRRLQTAFAVAPMVHATESIYEECLASAAGNHRHRPGAAAR